MLANSYKTTHDVLEALFRGICVSAYSGTLLVVYVTEFSSEAERRSSSSESDDSISFLDIGLGQRVSKPCRTRATRVGGDLETGVILPSLSFYSRTQRAVIFSLSLTLVVGINLYFSSSVIGKILANQ